MKGSYIWKRQIPFLGERRVKERWTLQTDHSVHESEVDVFHGKKLDIASIKKDWPYQREIDMTREKMRFFIEAADFVPMAKCPVCSALKEEAEPLVRICGVKYCQCKQCSHVFAEIFPSPKVTERYYKDNVVEDPYYINPAEIELRLKEIYLPKLDWIISVYRRLFGQDPLSVLDVGAGAGHFLHGGKQKGLEVAGVELDPTFAKWCKTHFDIELCQDPSELQGRRFDLLCTFNVLEHTLDPNRFIQEYRAFMHKKSLLVVETPKANSFTTWIQKIFPEEPRGQLVPYEHNHLFTDASLATLLFMNGLEVRSVWYFGQDMAELVLRICAELGGESGEVMSRFYGTLQQAVDLSRASDLMMFAATQLEDN